MNALLLALIPQGIEWITKIVAAISADPGTPAGEKVKLDAISVDLQRIGVNVQAVQLPDKQ